MEFSKIYKEEFGEELSMDQATEKALLVFNLVKVLLTNKREEEQNEN